MMRYCLFSPSPVVNKLQFLTEYLVFFYKYEGGDISSTKFKVNIPVLVLSDPTIYVGISSQVNNVSLQMKIKFILT